ncbi:MAG: alpha-galactosidase [Dehalococcoidia bacterium]|nr:MAG: alpha-galactosidase [Dehalococcoidia bacterium]
MGITPGQNEDVRIETGNCILLFSKCNGRITIGSGDFTLPEISKALIQLYYVNTYGKYLAADYTSGKTSFKEKQLTDVHGQGRQFHFTNSERDDGLELNYIVNMYDNRPFVLLRLSVTNRSRNNVYLHDLNLLQMDRRNGSYVKFEDNSGPLDFFKVGWHDWVYSGLRRGNQKDVDSLPIMKPFIGKMLYDPGLPIARGKGEFWGEGWGLLTDQKSAVLAGFVSTADQFGVLHVNCRAGSGELTLTAPADGILLEPGEEFQSEWGYVQFIPLPSANPAADYVDAVARQMNARVPMIPPPAQWTHWYHYFQAITADLFVANLNTIDSIRNIIPFKVVQLDDGYQSAWGDWTTCNAKFPLGLSNLSQNIKNKGYTPGLWLAPFVVDPRSTLAQKHPGWMVKDVKGKPIISGYFYDFYGYALDLTQSEVQEHVRSLLHTISQDWGFGFVKTDFVYAGGLPGIRQNPKMTRAQAFRKGMEAVRQGIGDETFLLGCGCPFGPAVGIVDAMRIGPDTAPNWTPYLWTVKWATPIIKSEKSIGSLRNNIRHTLNLSTQHRKWWWNDPDCLMVRNYDTTLTDDEVKSNLSLIGLSGGLMIDSDDLTRLSQERQSWVSLLTPILSKGGLPLDLLQNEMAGLYVLPVTTTWGNWNDVAVFNWDKKPGNRTLQLSQLGYNPGDKLVVFDFCTREHWITRESELIIKNIPTHGCRLLRICQLEDKPALVGDTLHITQGGEIESWLSTGKTLEIKTIDLGRNASGAIWLSLPGKLVKAVADANPVVFTMENEGIYRLEMRFQGRTQINIQWE